MKYLYCPRCKELRVKSWYQIKDRCQLCFSDATAIKIPNTPLTFALYVLYVVTPAFVALYAYYDVKSYLYVAIVLLVVMFVISWTEISRGMAYARAKVKITEGDSGNFRRRGWK